MSKLFDLEDIIIIPEILSSINSRKEVNPFDENGMYPLMTAPMDTVVNEKNAKTFNSNKIYSIIPRGERIAEYSINKKVFYSYSLDEFEDLFINQNFIENLFFIEEDYKVYALIDIANGHLKKLYDLADNAKEKYKERLVLMVGNVANPQTFEKYCNIGVDYVRLGIGNGAGCTTSANVAIGYPIGSLISECYMIKSELDSETKIISDGGCKNISDIIKCLFLGADYVMCGSIFNKAIESSGQLYLDDKEISIEDIISCNTDSFLPNISIKDLINQKRLTKNYRGMSTKEVQKKWGKEVLKTAEGISKRNLVEYTLSQWCENFEDYLRSTMSYTNSRELKECSNSQFGLISFNSLKRFNK